MLINKKLPTFLGIGAQKAGTSWLYRQLYQHPEVWMPPRKELDFFHRYPQYLSKNGGNIPLVAKYFSPRIEEKGDAERNFAKMKDRLTEFKLLTALWWMQWLYGGYDENWYRRLFLQGIFHQASGEISPSYSLLEEEDVARIKAINPQVKIIFLIRHPIERIWSAFRFHTSQGDLKLDSDSDDEVIENLKLLQSIGLGEYERTLEVYLKYFDSKQILVGFYDAILCDPVGLMSSVTDFLEIAPYADGMITNETRVNASAPREMPHRVKDYLRENYSQITDRFAQEFGSYAKIWHDTGSSCETVSQTPYSLSELIPAFHP